MKEWETKVCWNNVCLPKARAFSWLAGNRRILSGDCLRKMGFVGPFRCVLCEKAEEDVDHLLLNCEFAQEAWLFGLQRLNWKGPMAGNLCDWLDSWLVSGKPSTFATVWKILPSIVLWELWKERNRRVFEGKAENRQRFLIRLERAISELVSNAASHVNLAKVPFTQFDASFLLSWPLVKFRPVNGHLRANL
ncbi:uncharacterized protein LOC131049246 [Cryptomeria japonica]|uniref:uncharacterized protein LOC131049246 n=1 Tax=Cryptomeria japonica TaxID=3369 RepID=UPI0025ACC123|nr:uncharacterized protein LOC131049246 [Cryptomeria japonica]